MNTIFSHQPITTCMALLAFGAAVNCGSGNAMDPTDPTTQVASLVSAKLSRGARVFTTRTANVRGLPSASAALLGTSPMGTVGTIVDGPTVAADGTWWKILYDTDLVGWSRAGHLDGASKEPAFRVSPFDPSLHDARGAIQQLEQDSGAVVTTPGALARGVARIADALEEVVSGLQAKIADLEAAGAYVSDSTQALSAAHEQLSATTSVTGAAAIPLLSSALRSLSLVNQDVKWYAVMDFFVSDVCLDANGRVLPGVSPVDGDPACISHRDARMTDGIAYWHVSTPRRGQDASVHWAFVPYVFPKVNGLVSLKLYDTQPFGTREGYESLWTMYMQSSTTVASGGTSDHTGPSLFNGPGCTGEVTDPAARFDTSWSFVERSILTEDSNAHYEVGPFSSADRPGPCPAGHTVGRHWYLTTMTFPTAFGAKRTPPLLTLVTEYIADDASGHDERMYFTRELGQARWEGWDNMDVKAGAEQRRAEALKFEASGACEDLSGVAGDARLAQPPGPGDWITSGCVEQTNVAPPTRTRGDRVEPWIDYVRHAPLYAPLFGTAAVSSPIIKALSATSGVPGDTIVISGENFGSDNHVKFGSKNAVADVPSTASGTEIRFTIPTKFDGINMRAGTYELNVLNVDTDADSEVVKFEVTKDAPNSAIGSPSGL